MTQKFAHNSYDAVIIGARCAGAATAMLMARQGARVLIVDRSISFHDTLSTHALMRPAVSLLAQWGLLGDVIASGAATVTRTKFFYGNEVLDLNVKTDGDIPGLFAPRRWALDRILRDAAVAAGAEFHSGVNFESLEYDANMRVVGVNLSDKTRHAQTVKAGIVVGADGLRSSVAAATDARTLMQSEARSATVYTYVKDVPNEGYRWYFRPGKAAGLIPTNDGAHCLFTSTPPQKFKQTFGRDAFAGALEMLSSWEPDLATSLAKTGPIENIRKFPGSQGYVCECSGPGWALVGDSGYFKDPASAHGISDAFLDAARLSNVFTQSPQNVSKYQIDRNKHAPELFRITQKMASFDWNLEQLKSLHLELNNCMKAEAADLPVGQVSPSSIAA
jgi:2-polyprenyl-6-methoxyphenol hydroxylase-like FAD-dependent oxidoreductase